MRREFIIQTFQECLFRRKNCFIIKKIRKMVRLSRNDYPGTFGKDFVQKP